MAGVSRLQYTSEIRLIRVMCSGRVDLDFIFRSFANGQDGVFIGGCKLNECNYTTHGNYDALSHTYISKKILEHIGLNPERLNIEFMSSGDGQILAQVIDTFTKRIKKLGPLGQAEGIDEKALKLKLEAIRHLVPYIRLVEREKLRVSQKSEKAYHQFFTSKEFDGLFNETIVDKLAISQMMILLREKPISTGEISKVLSLSPSEVSRHMVSSSKKGLVRYDTQSKCYTLA